MPLRACLCLLLLSPALRAAAPEGVEFFEKKVRPVLVEHCYQCHSPEAQKNKKLRGGLLLDTRDGLLKGGDTGPALVPGEPDKSLLIKAVGYKDDVLRMPPRSKLPDALIADLTAWVKMGAPMPAGGAAAVSGAFDLEARKKHWSWQPLRPGPVPAVKDRAWPRSSLDAYILAALEAKGLAPAPEADRRTLLRRLSYDLTGLPPTPAEIRAFESDTSPDAYEKVVDRLLDSPHHGERWARHWLDLVRYADTLGHEFDFDLPQAYEYRDYVVRALNADVPYDQFVLEHLAGDLLANPRRHPKEGFNESVIGTGFFFLGEAKHSPVDVRQDGAERVDNQIDVFSKAFLGLTVSCARCHDHKFDAISTRDYYALAGYLRSSRFQRADVNPPGPTREAVTEARRLKRQADALAIEVTADLLDRSLARLADELPAVRAGKGLSQEKLTAWRRYLSRVDRRDTNHFLHGWLTMTEAGELAPEAFRRRLAELDRDYRKKTRTDGYHSLGNFDRGIPHNWFPSGQVADAMAATPLDVELQLTADPPVARLRGASQARSDLAGPRAHGVLRSPTFRIENKYVHLKVAGRGARVNLVIDGYQLIRDPIYGGLTATINHGDEPRWHRIDVSMWQGHRGYLEFLDEGDGWFAVGEVWAGDNPAPPPSPSGLPGPIDSDADTPAKLAVRYVDYLREKLGSWKQGRLDGRSTTLINQLLACEPLWLGPRSLTAEQQLALTKAAELEQAAKRLEGRLPRPRYVMALADGTGEDEHVFIRGNHKSPGPEVPRRFLEALSGKDQPIPPGGSGRLELARRVLFSSDPLLPRVLVNRLWHHHFGAGLVRSVDDFGVQGQPPSHPELLDWLATQLVRSGWSLKKMHRLMVTSSTYRMAGRGDSRADQADPENRLWHRMPVRRLEAEAIRDAVLAVSGRLDRTPYGPGVMPHLTAHMQGRGRPTVSGPLDGGGRRSLYLNVRRNFLTPLFLAFDYPVPFTTIGRRSVSNVPAQALTMMNNPFVRQQAELWAKRALAVPGTPAQRVAGLYEAAFGRLPTEDETAAAVAFIKDQGDTPAIWAELCHVLYNVKEFIFVS